MKANLHGLPLFFVVLTISLSVGCSKIRVGYELVDKLAITAVTDAFNLNSKQRKFVKTEIQNYKQWHRREMLPKYSAFLLDSEVFLKSQKRIDRKKFEEDSKKIESLMRETLRPTLKPAAEFMIALSPEQLAKFALSTEAQNKKMEKEKVPEKSARLKEYRDSYTDFWDDWLVELNPEQEKIVDRLLPKVIVDPDRKLWIEFRRKRQAEMLTLIQGDKNAKKLEAFFIKWLFDGKKHRPKTLQDKIEEARKANNELNLQVLQSLTNEQRTKLARRLADYREDFDYLHKKKND